MPLGQRRLRITAEVPFLCRSVADYQDTVERMLEADISIEKYFSYIVITPPIAGRCPVVERFAGEG